MKHLTKIQAEFVKKATTLREAAKWEDLSYEAQKQYLQAHRGSKKKITAKPGQSDSQTSELKDQINVKKEKITSSVIPDKIDREDISTYDIKDYDDEEGLYGTLNMDIQLNGKEHKVEFKFDEGGREENYEVKSLDGKLDKKQENDLAEKLGNWMQTDENISNDLMEEMDNNDDY